MTIERRFQDFLAAYPKRSGGNPLGAARKAFVARVERDKVDPQVIVESAGRYHKWCEHYDMINTPYVKQAQSFLGPKTEGWLETWDFPAEQTSSIGFDDADFHNG